jgi:hypothetical protein
VSKNKDLAKGGNKLTMALSRLTKKVEQMPQSRNTNCNKKID